jgi:hypothetical protein
MSTGEHLYLALVLCTFIGFGIGLALLDAAQQAARRRGRSADLQEAHQTLGLVSNRG